MTIFIDQDNVLNRFIDQVVLYTEKLFKLKVDFKSSDCKSWGVLDEMFPHASKEWCDKRTEEIFSASGFWSGMLPQPGAVEVMEKLVKDKHEVYIATMPWPTAKNCKAEKEEWVEKYLPFFKTKNIIFCPNKKFLYGDVILDDAPHIIENTPHCKHRIIYDYPYNQNVEASFRIKSWNEAYSVISNLER